MNGDDQQQPQQNLSAFRSLSAPQGQQQQGGSPLWTIMSTVIPALSAALQTSKWEGRGVQTGRALAAGLGGYAAAQPKQKTGEERYWDAKAQELERTQNQVAALMRDPELQDKLSAQEKLMLASDPKEFFKTQVLKNQMASNKKTLSGYFGIPEDVIPDDPKTVSEWVTNEAKAKAQGTKWTYHKVGDAVVAFDTKNPENRRVVGPAGGGAGGGKPPTTAEAALARFMANPTPQNKAMYDTLNEFEGRRKEDPRLDKSYKDVRSSLTKLSTPLEQQSERMTRLIESVNQRTPQADALVAPELLTVMAGGMGSGLRMNEAEISRIVGGRSNWETLQAKLNKWKTDPTKAVSITEPQRQQITSLIEAVNGKLQRRLKILNQAGTDLIDAKTVEEQRALEVRVRKELREVPTPTAQGTTGSGNTFTVEDVQ